MKRLSLSLVYLTLVACGGSNELFPITGTLERERLELIAEASEPILERPLMENARVNPGDLIVRLDDTRLRASLVQTEAARDRADRRLAELVRGPRVEEITEARARLAGAEKDLHVQKTEFERRQKLADDKLASQSVADQQRAARDLAQAARDEARARLEALLEGTTIEELDQARASLAEAQARVDELAVNLERLTIRAPRAGQIDALPFEIGEQPPAGAVVAVMLSDATPFVRLYLPASIRAQVSTGTDAVIHLEGRDQLLAGRVRYIASEASFTPYFALNERDRARLAFVAEIDVIDAPDDLPTGIPATVSFDGG